MAPSAGCSLGTRRSWAPKLALEVPRESSARRAGETKALRGLVRDDSWGSALHSRTSSCLKLSAPCRRDQGPARAGAGARRSRGPARCTREPAALPVRAVLAPGWRRSSPPRAAPPASSRPSASADVRSSPSCGSAARDAQRCRRGTPRRCDRHVEIGDDPCAVRVGCACARRAVEAATTPTRFASSSVPGVACAGPAGSSASRTTRAACAQIVNAVRAAAPAKRMGPGPRP